MGKVAKTDKPNETLPVTVLKWSFLIILAAVPFHGFLSTWAFTNFGYELFFKSWKEILLLLIAVVSVYLLLSNPKILSKIAGRTINRLIAAYAILHLIVALFTEQTSEALWHGLAINLRFLIFFVIAQILAEAILDKNFNKLAVRVVLVVATIVAALVLLQLLLPKEFLEWFGYSKETIPPYFTIDRNLDFVRYASTTRGPNVLGAYLILPLTAMTALFFKRYDWRKVIQALVVLAAMFLSFSRSAWLGLIASVGTYKLFFSPDHIKKFTRKALPALVLFVAVFIGVFMTTDIIQNVILHQDPDDTAQVIDSTDQHLQATKAGIEDIVENPLGSGPGTAGPASFRNDGQAKISENYFVQVGQEVGIIGLALFISINVVLGKMLLDNKEKSVMKYVLFSSLIGLTVVSMLLHGWADEEVAYTFWGLTGLYLTR